MQIVEYYIEKVVTLLRLQLRVTNFPLVPGMTPPCYRSLGQLETGDLLNFLFKLIKNIFEVPWERSKLERLQFIFIISCNITLAEDQTEARGRDIRDCKDSRQ